MIEKRAAKQIIVGNVFLLRLTYSDFKTRYKRFSEEIKLNSIVSDKTSSTVAIPLGGNLTKDPEPKILTFSVNNR